MRRSFAIFLLAGSAAIAAHAAPVAAPPGAQSFALGAVEIVALRDALNVVPNDGTVFGADTNPAAVAAVLRDAGAADDKVTLGVDALLVKGNGRIVLIDTGLGPRATGMLPASLAAAKVMPPQVTDIFITHGHGDHVGGLLAGPGKLAFPNATIRMAEAEWAFVKNNPANAALVATIADKVQTFAAGTEPVPGILAIAAPGHTPGHTLYEIRSGGRRLLDIGDSAHSSIVSLARPDWAIGYDSDKAEGKAQRMALLAKLAASHELVFAPHFPFPGIGRITGADGRYRWEPGVP
ncbi:MBL fold metallo-hydrolase [Sphingomonas nostoxanthinifaciens]|uniref:MBL fold metallo-hydrolase n=1 Tax=Sphingomonas nostoxanthinifaciens TaxID=2872652 RepID=UPI001CC1E607|nr:MBL fold metallo-hydrolase [Sphingomonas nostoxanthinifaciens]UAK25112.1 MBL fold metallo-hydrolase [Sphingomonas nostoxanthinifaciens]